MKKMMVLSIGFVGLMSSMSDIIAMHTRALTARSGLSRSSAWPKLQKRSFSFKPNKGIEKLNEALKEINKEKSYMSNLDESYPARFNKIHYSPYLSATEKDAEERIAARDHIYESRAAFNLNNYEAVIELALKELQETLTQKDDMIQALESKLKEANDKLQDAKDISKVRSDIIDKMLKDDKIRRSSQTVRE